jgi:LysR family transcriptional regulator, hydrogen peroxide-inducible genes activator
LAGSCFLGSANTHLSELGRIVMPHLQSVYDQTRAANRIATDFAPLKKTTLRLGIMCTIVPGQLVDLLKSITSRNPGIESLLLTPVQRN